jgi:prepilin-type N-terminal cleavage/methylation domain-containing protein
MKKVCSNQFGPAYQQAGFTLIELLLVLALITVTLTIATVNLFKPTAQAKIDSVSTDVVAILREAQNKAINTDTNGGTASNEYGVHFDASKYTLFKGTTFNQTDPNNFAVSAPQGITISSTLTSGNVVFQRISGEVISFDPSKNSVCIQQTALNKTTLLRINFVGVVDVLPQGC